MLRMFPKIWSIALGLLAAISSAQAQIAPRETDGSNNASRSMEVPSSNQNTRPTQRSALRLRSVSVNGKGLPIGAGESVSVPSHPGTMAFSYGPDPLASNAPIRFQCQLDGWEEQWHERSLAMRMVVRFINSDQSDIAEKEFTVTGESPGWTGAFADSGWIHRKETVKVPDGATHFWIVISSAGPPEAVGVFAVRNLVASLPQSSTNLYSMIPPMETDVSAHEAPPRGWERGGIRLSNAWVVRSGPSNGIALAIVDDHPNGHADWSTIKLEGPQLTPGETLSLEWDEVYSIGAADFGAITFTNVAAGLYRFRMRGLNAMGMPLNDDVSLPVTVPVSFWRTSWFWAAALLAAAGLTVGGWRLVSWRKIKRQLEAAEKQRAVEQERVRISRDIHDDLGARVTQISLLTSAAQQKQNLSPEAREDFGSVARMSRELVAALYETVWAVSPENDHLDSLASYLCQLANQMCEQAHLKCRLEVPDFPTDFPVNSQIRHNLVMAVKESIHNTVRHAQATEVSLCVRFDAGRLSVDVTDNGKGFDVSAKRSGNGVRNIERRMATIGGHAAVNSQPNAGTHVHLELTLVDI